MKANGKEIRFDSEDLIDWYLIRRAKKERCTYQQAARNALHDLADEYRREVEDAHETLHAGPAERAGNGRKAPDGSGGRR